MPFQKKMQQSRLHQQPRDGCNKQVNGNSDSHKFRAMGQARKKVGLKSTAQNGLEQMPHDSLMPQTHDTVSLKHHATWTHCQAMA